LKRCFVRIDNKLKITNLENTTGLTGNTNGYGEKTQKLDEWANELIVNQLVEDPATKIAAVMSEELLEPVFATHGVNELGSNYILVMDPIDGSPNLDINLPVGTIFGVYNQFDPDTHIPRGRDQLCSGYVLYSNATVLILTFGSGVAQFVLDPKNAEFVLVNDNLKIPNDSKIYSINEGSYNKFFDSTKEFLTLAKNQSYKLRYVGSMVADIHRTLLKGGIFIYPSDSNNEKGKLRMLYEINPMAFLVQNAGGESANDSNQNPLDIELTSHNQTLGIALGSKFQIKQYKELM
jgi:fructose-1,6-bisphosphatase I